MTAPEPLVTTQTPVTLVGGGGLRDKDLHTCLTRGPVLVAADGGADAILGRGLRPDAVIGDMDSLTAAGRAELSPQVQHHIPDQDSTDFEKCLTRIAAPLVLGVGFTARRLDHTLAVFNTLVRHPTRRCVLINKSEAITLLPPEIALPLEPGCRVSLFPMGAVTGQSSGLEWPIDGQGFAPDGAIGTSNRATGPVHLTLDAPRMLVFLPRGRLNVLLEALEAAPRWAEG
ncbi:thiamine diphosphokinase [Meridianimarinicoccus sp. MJW13]|uniref:thiamine diphosphokinase n=1 Tax=Meridianimarinicoccus sp. MJW13 TaxID=2720031 RepID=UPI0018667AA6|nr:thiamine diphosphokinase [Fluviibacterium sp. MJW13]